MVGLSMQGIGLVKRRRGGVQHKLENLCGGIEGADMGGWARRCLRLAPF